MNILVLYQSPWKNAASYYSYNLVKALKLNEHKVHFAGNMNLAGTQDINELDVKLHDINLFVHSPFKFLSNLNRIKKIIRNENIELLLPVSAPGHIISGFFKYMYKGDIPVIKFCLDNVRPTNNIFNKYLHNNLTNYLVFPGNSTLIRYDNIFKIKKYKILHAPLEFNNFLDFSFNSDLKRSLNIPENKIVVSFIGRFSPEKGIYFLIDIIKRVVEKSDKVFFLLSGSEEQIKHKDIWNLVIENNLQKNVKIIDRVDDVRKIMSITDIGILSSRYSEFICRIAMEFMAFKKPVVAPDLNVIPEVIENEKSGYIYDLNNSRMASDFILHLANNDIHRKLMGEMGSNRIKSLYSLEYFRKELDNVLMEL